MDCISDSALNQNDEGKKNDLPLKMDQQSVALRIIEEYITARDIPNWYRELSLPQVEAADSLFRNIRDDLEQGTSHRCRWALYKIGLNPVQPAPRIMAVLQMSRGNDLAFLWFLKDLFYANEDVEDSDTGYSLNQQLIMTCIAHLDMVTTMRELDKIIPRPTPKTKKKVLRFRKKSIEYSSPYLEPLPRPKFGPGKQLPPPQQPKTVLRPYDVYLDPNYIVLNESNRWFADDDDKGPEDDYLTQLNQKIALFVIDNTMKGVFSPNFNKENCQQATCILHKKVRMLRGQLEEIVDIVKRNYKVDKFYCNSFKKQIALTRIRNQLNENVDKFLDKLKNDVFKTDMKSFCKALIEKLLDDAIKAKEEDRSQHRESIDVSNLNCKYPACQDSLPSCFDYGFHSKVKRFETYFQAPQRNHHKLKFNYDKIFAENYKNNPIKNAIFTALDVESFINEDEAIAAWVHNTWMTELKDAANRVVEPEKTNVGSYDPRDKELMYEILKTAIAKMRKNPKFVLPTLPDAHKIPVLKEWIRDRFGLRYTKKERLKELADSRKVQEALRKRKIILKPPAVKDLAAIREIGCKCKEYALAKGYHLIDMFYQELNKQQMKDQRIYWLTMRGYQCTTGPPRGTFFAYMPAREYDIFPFRPWKSNEYVDAATAWNRRISAKNKENEPSAE